MGKSYKRYLEPDDNSSLTKYMSKRVKRSNKSGDLSHETKSSSGEADVFVEDHLLRNREIQADEVVNNKQDEEMVETMPGHSHEANDLDILSNDDDEDDFFLSITNQIIHPNLECKITDAITMILGFFLRHGLTWVALEDLLDLFHNILGDESRLPKTKYFFKKCFEPNEKAIFHFYCKSCMLYIGTYEQIKSVREAKLKANDKTPDNCANCESEYSLHKMNSNCFFVQLPLRDQLEKKLSENPEILNYNTNPDPNDMTDIFDGELYKSLKATVGSGPLVTLTMNTDGVKVFKSKKKASMWPIQLFINEVSPRQRFKKCNIILTGIWFGKDANFDLYFKPLIEELKDMDERKISIKSKSVTIRILLITADSVARCKFLKMKQFNGEFGCTYCLHPGFMVGDSTTSKYILTKYTYSLRTHASTVALMKSYVTSGSGVLGIMGVSPLIAFKNYDLIRGTVFDYMHGLLEGVSQLLSDLWFDSKNHREKYYITPRRAEFVEKNLKSITPLRTFTRKPRETEERSFWKAHEFKYWLLFYGVPCLKGLLNQTYLNHFSLLSEATFIFLKSRITPSDQLKASKNLEKFITEFQILYGEDNMVYNVHLLEHVPKCVKECGPLWAYSNFNFESNNGSLVNHVKGTTDVEHQIVSKYSLRNVLARLKNNSDTSFEFLERMKSTRVKRSTKIGEVTLFGSCHKHKLQEHEKTILQKDSTFISAHHKFFHDNDVYYSITYKRSEQTNDTVILLKDQTVGQIVLIFTDDGVVLMMVKILNIEPVHQFPAHIKRLRKELAEEFIIVRADEVLEKMLLISTTNESYVSRLPNHYEGD